MSRYARDFNTLKRELLARRELFEDQDFTANNRSIMGNSVLPGNLPDKKVEWKRPHVSISRAKVTHFVNGIGLPYYILYKSIGEGP